MVIRILPKAEAEQRARVAAEQNRAKLVNAVMKDPATFATLSASVKSSVMALLDNTEKVTLNTLMSNQSQQVALAKTNKASPLALAKQKEMSNLVITVSKNPSGAQTAKNAPFEFRVSMPNGDNYYWMNTIGSVRFYGDGSIPQSTITKLIAEMNKNPDTRARFNALKNDDELTVILMTSKNPANVENVYKYAPGADGSTNAMLVAPGYGLQWERNGKKLVMRPDIAISHEIDHAQFKATLYFPFMLGVQSGEFGGAENREEYRAWSNEVTVSKARGFGYRKSYFEPSAATNAKFVSSTVLK
jgi:hypothetical protein